MDNSKKPAGTPSGPVRTRRVSLPHNAKPYERKRPPANKKKQNKEDEPEGLLAMLKTVITKPLGWIYRGSQPQPTTTTATSTPNGQETIGNNGINLPQTESHSNSFSSPYKEKSPPTSPRRKPPTQSLYAPKPVIVGSRKTLTLANSTQHPNHSPIQPQTDHELMIERVAAIPTPIRLKQTSPPSADSMDVMECEDSIPSVPINDFNARMSAFFQSKGNAPLTDEERQLILESVGQPSRFPPESQSQLRPQQYMSSEIPNSSSYANQSPFVTRKRAFPVSPTFNALPYHTQYNQASYPSSDILRPNASSSRDYGGHVVESVPGSSDRFGGSRMDIDRRYDLERPGKRRDLRSNEERRRLQAMNEYAGNQDSFNAATAERIIQSLQRDNRTPLLDARRAPSSMYSRKGLTDTRRGQREMYPMEELPPSRPLATPILPPSRSTRATGPYTKDRRAVKQRAAALAAARKETDEDATVSLFSSSVSAVAATPVAAQLTPKKKTSATAAQMLAGIPMKGKGDNKLLKSISRTEDEDMEVDSDVGKKKSAAREIAISGEASRAFLTKPPSELAGSGSTTETLFNFTNKSQTTVSMTPTPLAAALKPKQVDADAMDEGDEDGKKQQGFSKRISLKARPAPRIPPKREKRGFSAEDEVEVDEETIARENALKEIPALPIGNLAFAMKPSEPGVFKVPGLPASASNKPAEVPATVSTPFKLPTAADISVVPSAAPVTPATFSMVSPSKTTSPFANLTSTTPAAPPPTSSLYAGPAPHFNFQNVPTSNGTDASTTVIAAKPDSAPPVISAAFGSATPAVTFQPSTISTTPFGTPTVSKTSTSLFGTTNTSVAPPALPVFSFPTTSATAKPSVSEAASISTSKENVGPPAILPFGKPTGTTEPEVSVVSTAVPSIASEVKATPTPAPVAFNFGTPVKPEAKMTAPSTPEGTADMQMSPAQTPTSGSTASGPPAISFGPPAISGGIMFGGTTQPVTAPATATTAPSGFTGFAFNKPAATTTPVSSGAGFAFGSTASTAATGGSGSTFVIPTSTSTSAPPAIFSFGSTGASDKTPTTGFGAPLATTSTPAFGSATTASSSFNFGSTPAATSLAPSPYSFGVPSASGASGTGSATTTTTTTTTATPAFNFGGGAATSNAPATGFTFAGAAKKEGETKLLFGSGTPTPSTTTTTAAGAPSTGGFFGSSATGAKPTFGGFGAASTTAAPPAASTPFTFGQSGSGVTPAPATGGGSGFTFGVSPATGSAGATAPSAGFGFGGTSTGTTAGTGTPFQFSAGATAPMQGGGFGSTPTPFAFGGMPTPAAQSNVVSGTPSFQFGTGVPNGNPTGAFSFQEQQQQQQQQQQPAAAQQTFGFAFGAPQAAMVPPSAPQGGMAPFTFGAPSATGSGEPMFSMGSSSNGGGAKSGRAIARPRSKKRG